MELIFVQLVWAFLSFLALLIGGVVPFFVVRCGGESGRRKLFLSLSNCFACGIFLSTCFLGLIPHVRLHALKLIQNDSLGCPEPNPLFLGSGLALPGTETLVLLGFLLILFLEQLFSLCHGENTHKHTLEEEFEFEPLVSGDQTSLKFKPSESCDADRAPSLSIRSVVLLLGLGVHSVFEGLALGVQDTIPGFLRLLLAVMFHEVLCSLAFGLTLAEQKTSLGTGFLSVVLLCITLPLGMCLGFVVPKGDTVNTVTCRYLLEGIAAGTFVYVACVEMMGGEFAHSHGGHSHEAQPGGVQKLVKAFSVLLGFLAFLALSLLTW